MEMFWEAHEESLMPRQMNATELSEFYHQIGAALWNIQYLEDALVTFLVVKIIHERRCAGQTITKVDADALRAEKRKLTLGPLIESCVKRKIIGQNLQWRFDAFKIERHWLVHRSLVDSGDDLYEDVTREAIFRRIDEMRKNADSLKAIVFADMKTWTVARGVSVDRIQKDAKAAIRKLKGKE